jgi:hypothetical protein
MLTNGPHRGHVIRIEAGASSSSSSSSSAALSSADDHGLAALAERVVANGRAASFDDFSRKWIIEPPASAPVVKKRRIGNSAHDVALAPSPRNRISEFIEEQRPKREDWTTNHITVRCSELAPRLRTLPAERLTPATAVEPQPGASPVDADGEPLTHTRSVNRSSIVRRSVVPILTATAAQPCQSPVLAAALFHHNGQAQRYAPWLWRRMPVLVLSALLLAIGSQIVMFYHHQKSIDGLRGEIEELRDLPTKDGKMLDAIGRRIRNGSR